MYFFINQLCPENHYPYVVQPGDTLYLIAQRLEVSLPRILEANPGIDPYNIYPGLTICIPACPPEYTAYIIRAGDTLYAIARRFNVSIESILEANPSIEPNFLRIGQRICIPVCPPNHITYTVRAGDTLYIIGRRFNVSVESILEANPGLDPLNIYPGLRICIPGCPSNSIPYTIREGDTLYAISQRYNVSVESILEANPGLDPRNLYAGLRICIPLCPENGIAYTIRQGDTIYALSRRYNVSVESILEANPGLDPLNIYPGLRICIPVQSNNNTTSDTTRNEN